MTALDFTLTHEFEAPRALVFRQWTNAADIAKWFAPETFEVTACEVDARPGGSWMVRYQTEDGEPIEEHGVYLAIETHDRLQFTLQHRWSSGSVGPLLTCSVQFSDTATGTRVEFTQSGSTSTGMRDGMREGWRTCFSKLALHLDQAVAA